MRLNMTDSVLCELLLHDDPGVVGHHVRPEAGTVREAPSVAVLRNTVRRLAEES